MNRILITGAAGFLGSHLAQHHLKTGDYVWGVDNFSSSTRSSSHFHDLCAHPHFTMIEGDISEFADKWYQRIKRIRFDKVYNFACPASPPIYQRIPVQTTMTCVVGTKRMLDLAGSHGAIFIQASTSEVYGDPVVSPQPETYWGSVNSYGPRSCYDEGKRAAEALCFDYRNSLGVDVRLVRIFNTYGPHMDPQDGRVISNFICQGIRKENLTVYGAGRQTRSFCYVDDLIRGIVALGDLPKNPGTPINIGNPTEFTISSLAWKLSKRFGVEINYRGLPTDDPGQRCPDISLAQNLLGWEPKVNLNEGLDRTIAYFEAVLKGN